MTTMNESTGRYAELATMLRQAAGNERGSALVIALIALVVVTVIATAGYNLAAVELDTSRDFRANTQAFYAADRGLNRYLATDASNLVSQTTYSFQNGTSATVRAEPVVQGMSNGESLHRITSTGEYGKSNGQTITRTISTLVMATPLLPTMPNATYASNAGVQQSGGPSAVYDGNDAYGGGNSYCDAAAVGGSVRGLTAETFSVSGGGGPPGGSSGGSAGGNSPCETGANVYGSPNGPECTDNAASDFMTADQWQSLKSLQADHTISDGDAFPSTGDDNPPRDWPIVRVTSEDYSFSGTSCSTTTCQGILIAEGNVTFNGDFQWEGIILTGGTVTGNGIQDIVGSMVTGLDELLGETVSDYSLGNGKKSFQYNSCSIYQASTASLQVTRVPSSLYQGD